MSGEAAILSSVVGNDAMNWRPRQQPDMQRRRLQELLNHHANCGDCDNGQICGNGCYGKICGDRGNGQICGNGGYGKICGNGDGGHGKICRDGGFGNI